MFEQIKNYTILALVVIALGLGGQNWVLIKLNKQLTTEIAVSQQNLLTCQDNNSKFKADSDFKDDSLNSLEDSYSEIVEDFDKVQKEFDKFKRNKCNTNSTKGREDEKDNSPVSDGNDMSKLAGLLQSATCIANDDCKPSETPSSTL